MIKNSLIIILLTLLSCSYYTMRGQGKDVHYNIHFMDDFDNNMVSLSLNNDTIISQSVFRKSDLPQLRQLRPIHIQVSEKEASIYLKGKEEKKIPINKFDFSSIAEISIKVDSDAKVQTLDPKKGKYVLISYNKGSLDIKQSNTFNQ